MKKIFKLLLPLIIGSLVTMLGTSCKKQHYTIETTTDVNIVDYLRKYPDQFSELVKVLDKTNISPYLNAYGAYTIFAPTNDAIKLYLQKIGKASVDDIDSSTWKNICRLHLIQDTIRTTSFTDGKLYTPTMYGQFLTTSVNDYGVTIVNRQAAITQSNILTGNGYIHVIDHVLQPATQTIAQMVEANSKYSIYTQALKATGLYDTLNIVNNPDTTRRWLTFLAESDSVLKLSGINTYTDLQKKYNNTGDPKNPNDSLFLYMAYHILTNLNYLADIVSAPSHPTLAPSNVVTSLLSGQTILLNQAVFNGVFEQGIQMDRANSDNSCTNGVVHALLGDIYLKIRSPFRVDFDIADQPEIRKLTSIFRRAGKYVQFSVGQLANVTWQQGLVQYTCEPATTTNYYWYDDHLDFGLRTNPVVNSFIEFTTPLIVKGKYKVWVNYRRGGQGNYTQVFVDDVPLSRIVDLTAYLPSTTATPAVLESQGFKRYSANIPTSNSTQAGELAGVVDIATTDVHKIKF
ncbi:MAG: fasciclin domain-containing protein, partial [Bacteroidota bacterium]|nr:fasciclin domain-containing protein [Bacteroidota bacterium]